MIVGGGALTFDLDSNQPSRANGTLPGVGRFPILAVLRRSFAVFFSNQRGFWRLGLVTWLLLCILGGSPNMTIAHLMQGGTLDVFKWLAAASIRFLILSAIMAPTLVAWHQYILRAAPLPSTWISPFKQNRTTLRFLLGLFAFIAVIGLIPRLIAYLTVGHLLTSETMTLSLAGSFLAIIMAGVEIILLLALFKFLLIFPELATDQHSNLRATWRRSTPAPFRFFLLLLGLYLIDQAITFGTQTPLNIWTWVIVRNGSLSVTDITFLYTWIFGPLFKLIFLASAVIGAIALSLAFKELSRLRQNVADASGTS